MVQWLTKDERGKKSVAMPGGFGSSYAGRILVKKLTSQRFKLHGFCR